MAGPNRKYSCETVISSVRLRCVVVRPEEGEDPGGEHRRADEVRAHDDVAGATVGRDEHRVVGVAQAQQVVGVALGRPVGHVHTPSERPNRSASTS
jgi:hypothetical protein